jgi:hypothetical protein
MAIMRMYEYLVAVTFGLLLFADGIMANETRGISDISTLNSGDTNALIQATKSSFDIIAPLSLAR